jgi:GrpB-like predicted nucleotidyltransferase (UPF0157 family)
MGRLITVVDPDPAWNTAFNDEAAALAGIFGNLLVAVHHVGSTAVPGLAAKPIIDILVVLKATDSIARFDEAMRALGYRIRGECLDAEVPGTPGRFYYSKDTQGIRTHHVHACAAGHSEVRDKLAFRDYLRTHPQQGAAYGVLKRRLALDYPHDNISYMRCKDLFVKSVLEDARRWYRPSASGSFEQP